MMLVAVVVLGPVAFIPRVASAEGLFDFFFAPQKQQQRQAPAQANFFADPFGLNQQPAPPKPVATAGSGPAFCVRSCDGKYFPIARAATPRRCRCARRFARPAPPRSSSAARSTARPPASGERYADTENAFAYRKALRADCTCNGRDPAGLAPVDLTLDSSLRAGDVIATTSGLVAYTGVRLGANQTADFTPVASYPGLTADVRARLGEMKVAPVIAETVANDAPLADASRDVLPVTVVPKTSPAKRNARK